MIIPNNMISHVGKIFQGEYATLGVIENPYIIDIGANVGGFAVWAHEFFKNPKIDCYEPIKANYDLLRQNIEGTDIAIRNIAIGKEDGKRMMYYGLNNCGESSLFQGERQLVEGEMVKVMSSQHLPRCDIMKIDTEGAEIEILENLVNFPYVFLIEFHSAYNRRKIDQLLLDYTLLECTMRGRDYGILKYIKTIVMEDSNG
jgi:FkbM family methyltransferase